MTMHRMNLYRQIGHESCSRPGMVAVDTQAAREVGQQVLAEFREVPQPRVTVGVMELLARYPRGSHCPCAKGSCGSIDEAVAEADDRFDLFGGRSELASKPSDVDINRARLDRVFVAPHAFQQAIA